MRANRFPGIYERIGTFDCFLGCSSSFIRWRDLIFLDSDSFTLSPAFYVSIFIHYFYMCFLSEFSNANVPQPSDDSPYCSLRKESSSAIFLDFFLSFFPFPFLLS